MACIRQRRGRYVLDYRAGGRRRWRTFPLTEDGLRLAEIAKGRLTGETAFAADTTFGEYSRAWLEVVKSRVGELTLEKYEIVQRVHLAPLHKLRVTEISRRRLKAFLVGLIADGMKKGTATKVLSVARNIFAEALDEGMIEVNPAARMGARLGLSGFDRENIRALDGEQLAAFLATLRATEAPEDALPLMILAQAGLRIGEMAGLTVDDVFEKVITIERQVLPHGRLKLPKGDKTRTVDLADDLRDYIAAALAARREYDLRTGRRSPWLVCPDLMGPVKLGEFTERGPADTRARRAMARVLRAAKLPPHFTPHCLRHTYASLLLQRGESLLYVSRQLGHSSIKLTADTYGRWLPIHPVRGGPNLLTRAVDGSALPGVDSQG